MDGARRISTVGVQGLGAILGWAAEEGWNPGLDDAPAFHAADPAGFFLLEADGLPAAAVSVVNHGPEVAFLGLYLCRPEFRGRGHGLAVWGAALAHAGDRAVGLDGVPAQQANYARSGFVPAGATLRIEGRLAPAPAPGAREARAEEIAALAALDAAANGYAKPDFLRAWLTPTATRRTAALDGPDGPLGFATARLCRRGAKLGPVIAPDAEAALDLIRGALALVGREEAVVDVPEANAPLRARLAALGFAETFPTARMWRGRAPAAGPGLQAAGTLELG